MPAGPDSPDFRSIQQKVVAKQFNEALRELAGVLETDPANAEALYMAAVCHRYTSNFPAALETIARLKSVAPEYGRAYQEEAHTYRDMGRPEEALRNYVTACRFNPALAASWRGQRDIFDNQGLKSQADAAREQLTYLEGLPRVLVGVMDLISQGRLLKAEDICRQFLQKIPHQVEGMRLLAEIGKQLGVLDEAEFLLESALKFEPGNTRVRVDYVQVLHKRQKVAQALEQTDRLLQTAPANPQFLSLHGIAAMQCGDFESALESFDAVLAQLPGDPVTWTSKGHAFKTSGNYEAAVRSYHVALESHPLHGEAWYSLANLKVYVFSDDEIASMEQQERGGQLGPMQRVHVCFALGKAYEDRESFARSFEFYARGNRLKKSQSRYQAAQMSEELNAQREVCTPQFFAARACCGFDAPDPVFIVGLPRAGSTLLEQILSSHSMVDGTLELPNILSLSQRLRRRGRQREGSGYPEILADLDLAELRAFGEEYIHATQIHRRGAALFIDKMPNNFRHIGLIHLILPNARIIDARRRPMACCFSGFKQLFAEGQEFSYDLEDLGRYYADYVRLMDHWDAVLPRKVLRVHYEDVVDNLELQVRRLLDYCALPFESACLDFHRTDRSVRTPSSEQVRQPIYRGGLEQWRYFEPWLAPLKNALQPVADRYPLD